MFILAPHLIFMLGIVGVALANQSLALGGILLSVYAAGLYLVNRRNRHLPKRAEQLLTFLVLGLSLLYTQFQGLHPFFAIQYWLSGLLVVRSFCRPEKRDFIFGFLISATLFAHVGRTYEDLPFFFLALAYLWLTPYALFYFLCYFGGFQRTESPPPRASPRLTFAQVRFMSVISLSLAALTTVLFLVIPRPARSANPIPGLLNNPRPPETGLTDNVSLGTFDRVTQKTTIVMTVETDKPMLWRGAVLDYYDNGIWYSAARYLYRRGPQTPPLKPNGTRVTRRFEIFNVQLTNFELFSAGTIVSFRQLKGHWRTWINDLYSTISVSHAGIVPELSGAYELVTEEDNGLSGSGELLDRRWEIPNRPDEWIQEKDLFLQVPASLSGRVRTLAADLTRGLDSDEAKAEAVQRHLSRNYRYSLKNLDSGALSPLDYFLFESKAGHCEYFATTMAMLLRCAGVRARVAQGFSPGTRMDDRYVVRLSDAHLWTEVFLPGQGWKTYDPTPGRLERLRIEGSVSLVERMKLKWQSYVLNYDRAGQTRFFGSVKQGIVTVARFLWKNLARAKHLVAPACLVILAILLFRSRIRLDLLSAFLRRFGSARPAVNRVRSYFGQYLRELSRRGYRRDPGTTPNDLLAALQKNGAPILDEARFLTRLFYETRFGGADLPPAMTRDIEAALRRIRNWDSPVSGIKSGSARES